MDTQKFNLGWALFTIDGLIPNETAKARRWLKRIGAQKIAPQTYVRSCVRGHEGLEKFVNEFKSLGTKETSLRALYVTRAQWERSFMVHGMPSTVAA